jgi:hypothetical protein
MERYVKARDGSERQQLSSPLQGPGLVVGRRIGEMVGNFRRNLTEGRMKLVMGVAAAIEHQPTGDDRENNPRQRRNG